MTGPNLSNNDIMECHPINTTAVRHSKGTRRLLIAAFLRQRHAFRVWGPGPPPLTGGPLPMQSRSKSNASLMNCIPNYTPQPVIQKPRGIRSSMWPAIKVRFGSVTHSDHQNCVQSVLPFTSAIPSVISVSLRVQSASRRIRSSAWSK